MDQNQMLEALPQQNSQLLQAVNSSLALLNKAYENRPLIAQAFGVETFTMDDNEELGEHEDGFVYIDGDVLDELEEQENASSSD